MEEQDILEMANIMVQVRQANEDVGQLVAEALQTAGKELGEMLYLVTGRPGSWEADIILRMARAGGSGSNPARVHELSRLFVKMGEAGEDGGDLLSLAMGKAVDQLGGLNQFAGMSRWYWDLTNMGRQYSNHDWNE